MIVGAPTRVRIQRHHAARLWAARRPSKARTSFPCGGLRTYLHQLAQFLTAVGYKQLLEVERGWRDMKSVLDLRPVYHRLEDRIGAHVLLCWLALLLVRVAETTTGHTWATIRANLDRLHIITFTGASGTFRQSTELSKPQRDLFTALDIHPPKKIIEVTTTHATDDGEPTDAPAA